MPLKFETTIVSKREREIEKLEALVKESVEAKYSITKQLSLILKCLTLIRKNKVDSNEFKNAVDKLEKILSVLEESDRLIDEINTTTSIVDLKNKTNEIIPFLETL